MEACCSRFTAAEGGARLAAAAGAQNTLAVEYAPFIATRLLHEEAYKIRGLLSAGRQRSVFVCRASRVRHVAYELNILTDLAVTQGIQYEDIEDWSKELDVKEVLVCTSVIFKRILEEQLLNMENINVLILDSCHLIWKDVNIQYIMKTYKQSTEDKRPRILALTYPLFSSNKKYINTTDKKEETDKKDNIEGEKSNVEGDTEKDEQEENSNVESDEKLEEVMGVCKNLDDFPTYEKLEWKIEELEKELCCKMDLAEDVDGGKRLSSTIAKPRELIIEYSGRPPAEALSEAYADLETFMRDSINDALDFLHEHRHDPTEIYGDELYEEFMNIPDPKLDPKQMFNHFIYVLDQLGPYAADKAAFSLLIKLEKLKIKVPYERHFLLLCLCTTVFVKIRSYAEFIFGQYTSDWEKIKTFSTPKVLRFAEILEQFQPPDMGQKIINRNRDNGTITKMLQDIEQCDFTSLGNKIEDKVNTIECNLKYLNIESKNDRDSEKNEKDNRKNEIDNKKNETDSLKNNLLMHQRGVLGFPRRTGHRLRARGRVQRNNAARVQQMQMNPDALCGIVFMKEALMAKIMFMLIVDMSRCHPRLSYLCAQYCAVEPKSTELAECQRQGRKQEDVLKKFRMHECNLLLATSALEEGIDLPRCNLVLRWDVPPSYRSYGLCRGRARAPRAATALLCTDSPEDTDTVLHNVAIYRELDQMITRKCGCGIQNEPPPAEEDHADNFTRVVRPYTPNDGKKIDDDNHKDQKDKDENNEDSSKNENDSLILDIENREDTIVLLNAKASSIGIEKDTELSVNDNSHKNDEASHGMNNKKDDNSDVLNDHLDSEKNENDDQLNDEVNNHKDDQDSEITTNFDNNSKDRTQSVKSNLERETNINEFNNTIPVKNENDNKLKIVESNELCISIETAKKYTQNAIENKIDSRKNVCNSDIVVSECKNDNDNECCEKNENDNKVDKDKKLDCKKDNDSVASVDLSTAIALINRYCGKLPSDTFTRLAPQWWLEEVQLPTKDGTRPAYICTLRLPLNCPVKYNIVGHPMPTKVLARRMVALQACRILHKSGELDNQLMPIGKENFKAAEIDTATNYAGCGDTNDPSDTARPGTTKRRQYYFKRTAWAFTDCQPVVDTSDSEIDPPEVATPPQTEAKGNPVKESKKGTKHNMLYAIVSKLWCALPERYNTRGRRLHAPQHASQAIGILMARNEPDSLQIPSFPVYTRSGEVRVRVDHVPDADVRLSPTRGRLVRRFMRFVFAEVLRVRRRGMKLQSEGSTHNNYYIVPTIKTTREDGTSKIDIDWAFLELIYQHTEEKKHSELEKPSLWHHDEEEQDVTSSKVEVKKKDGKIKMENPLLKSGETFVFDAEKYKEAVVTPWYRNQDQPQFFLVAEICWNLTPDSAFPSPTHTSFRHYYNNKYNVVLTQSNQPLLDVDHTSARLNLLTPRYVNRKGVALPVSSERTRRAKRDRLDQKQILVPELCRVHPFAAPLWFATVALPCVLYRINALLIADEIRRAVAIDVGLGIPKIDEKTCPGFQWPPLDFGWSLAEVLSADSEKEKKKDEEDGGKKEKELIEKDEESREVKEKADQQDKEEIKEKTINDILQEKEDAESGFEIGMWSNDMASSIPQSMEYDEFMEPLPPNLTFCTSASGGANWCDPVEKPKSSFNPSRSFSMADSDCSYMTSDFDTDDSDLDSEGSDEDTDTSGFCSNKNTYASMGVRIEYKTAHEAEAVDLEAGSKARPAPALDQRDDARDRLLARRCVTAGDPPHQYIEKFRNSVAAHKKEIIEKGHLINHDQPIKNLLPESTKENLLNKENSTKNINLEEIFPYNTDQLKIVNNQICLESIERNKRKILNEFKASLPSDEIKKLNCFSMVDVDIDSPNYVNEKVANVGFDSKSHYEEKLNKWDNVKEFKPYYEDGRGQSGKEFDFDYQPELEGHPGPSPSVILQALTMSNANDGINLERLETIGDSFLKFAITVYLYCAHPTVHEGKLSHMRSKQVSNLNLYRLGRNKRLGARMIASKFEPHDNWLPPCHRPPHTLHPSGLQGAPHDTDHQENSQTLGPPPEGVGCFIPYNLITQHSIPDKSIADCVEALIGAYLLECGPRGALLFMSWLGIRVLPRHELELPSHRGIPVCKDREKSPSPLPPKRPQAPSSPSSSSSCSSEDSEDSEDYRDESSLSESVPAAWRWRRGRPVGSLRPYRDQRGRWMQQIFGELKAPPSPLLRYIADPEGELEQMLSGYEALERTLQYRFRDRSLLLQALTHASHHHNRLTDCYQRLEFLGDAILDYLITRHLYCDRRRHSPGALTDLRSALVNNTIFATLAARHGFHKYFRHMSPGLNEVLTKYVKIQEENGHSISEEHYLIQEDEMEQAEDVEVPKALGDLFESVAGAIFLDSGMSLGAVWKSYVNLMGAELEAFSAAAPKSPVRELLEAEPDTAKFGKPERLADGRRVRVCVEVFGRGQFKGVGRNYRIAKGTAARCALRHLKVHRAR